MHKTYAAYLAALAADDLVSAMTLETRYYRLQDRAQRRYVLGMTALWAACLALPVHLLSQILP